MKPFEGIRIVDFTQAHAGSLATMLLADMGRRSLRSSGQEQGIWPGIGRRSAERTAVITPT